MNKLHMFVCAALLLPTFSVNAQIITVNYTGEVTDIGSLLIGDGISVGTGMTGSFTYDTTGGGVVDEFTTSFANGFSASLGASGGSISVLNDVEIVAGVPSDGFTINASNTSSNTLNGYSSPFMQFGILQSNADGQLWDDTLPPDLADWSLITLAAINNPDWRWMDFGLVGGGDQSDVIRWEVSGFTVSAVPVPAAVWLFGTALIGLIGFGKRRKAAA